MKTRLEKRNKKGIVVVVSQWTIIRSAQIDGRNLIINKY